MQTKTFEDARPRMLAVASRMLGSHADAEEAVQETWLRTVDVDDADLDSPTAWLTTVVSRVCLDMMRARRDTSPIDSIESPDPTAGPDDEAQLADAVGAALDAVVSSLNPTERVAFVLHDIFGVPFDDVAAIVGKSPAATRQVASRARKRVSVSEPAADSRRAQAVSAFLAASRDGDFRGLVDLLDPDAVFRTYTDDAPVSVVEGRDAIAEAFMFRATTALTALVDGRIGVMVPHPAGGELPYLVMDIAFTSDGRIAGIDSVLRSEELAVVALSGVV